MVSNIATVISTLMICGVGSQLFRWRRNYNLAKRTGLPVHLSPVHVKDVWWLVVQDLLIPIIQAVLPRAYYQHWLPLTRPFHIFQAGYTPFADTQSDTYIIVSPRGNTLWTADPALHNQINSQDAAIPNDLEVRSIFSIFGPTITTTIGQDWRFFRKVTTACFNNATHEAAWKEGLKQIHQMTEIWQQTPDHVVHHAEKYLHRLSLHVLSLLLFGKELSWRNDDKLQTGHTMTFSQSLSIVIDRLALLVVVPRFLLSELRDFFRDDLPADSCRAITLCVS